MKLERMQEGLSASSLNRQHFHTTFKGRQFFMSYLEKMKRIACVSLMLSLAVLVGCGGSNDGGSVDKGTLLKAIVIKTGSTGTYSHTAVTDSTYDAYFKQGTAEAGVAAVIAAGKFYINGIAVPATATECNSQYPNGYLVNQVAWLTYSSSTGEWTGGYKAQGTATTSYADAALAVAQGIVSGLEIRLYDTDNDGYTDLIDADFKEGVQVNTVTNNGDGTYSVYRGDIDTANKTSYEGNTFDGSHFTSTSGERIRKSVFDTTIASGDVALFWYGASGWAMQRAKEVNGIFVDGADHSYYNIDGVEYDDAMRFSRDNLFISNRPGEFTNAQKYFALNNNGEGLKVSLWLVPTTDSTTYGAPVGLTSNSSAKTFLAEAIQTANEKLASVTVSADGTDVATTAKWVTQAEYDQLDAAITRAKAAMSSATSSNSLLDYQIYILYLSLAGSADDIGAVYGGFSYTGFDNEVQYGTKP
jgi:hypothetical protein